MACSGVEVKDEVVKEFTNLKLGHHYRFIQLKLTDDFKRIEVEKTAKDATYEEFLEQLPPKDCRYIVYDMKYKVEDGVSTRDATSVVFFVWCPDTASVKKKMLYASSKDGLKKKLEGISVEIQGADLSDFATNEVVDKCKKKH